MTYSIMTYEEYINSDLWKEKRQICIDRDVVCQTCLHDGSLYSLEVHHKTYPEILYRKNNKLYSNWNLDESKNHILLCHECHEAITNVIRSRKYDKNIEVNAYKSITDKNIRQGDLDANQNSKFQINQFVPDAYAQRSISRSIE